MGALTYTITETPVDIVAALGLTAGRHYHGQNLSTVATLYGLPKTTSGAPATTAPAFRYESGSPFQIHVKGSEKTFLWTDDPSGCPIILNEL